MYDTSFEDELAAIVDGEPSATTLAAPTLREPWRRRLLRWWRDQTTSWVEDEAIGSDGLQARQNRHVLPLVLPVLCVAGLLVLREPGNVVAALCLAFGAVAIAYAVIAEAFERRVERPFRVQLLNTAVYALIIGAVLWCFLTIEHPRPHTHWIIFFLYFLLIGSTGLSDDPRQPVCAGIFSIISYLVVVSLLSKTVAAGTSVMATLVAPQFEWVADGAKVGLLAAATFTGAASARRGRAVRRMSLRDGLTGLLNRHAFDRCLEHLAARARRNGQPMMIAMIDIDHFKALNDAHGHPTGDAVLRWISAWLQRSFRTTDVVSRYGGEEFLVAFVDADDAERVADRLESLRSRIAGSTLHALGTHAEFRVTVSIGIAQMPEDGSNVREVLACADGRLYEAKRAGRDRIVSQATGTDG